MLKSYSTVSIFKDLILVTCCATMKFIVEDTMYFYRLNRRFPDDEVLCV